MTKKSMIDWLLSFNLSTKIIVIAFIILSVLSISLSYIGFKNYRNDLISSAIEADVSTNQSLTAHVGSKADLDKEKLLGNIQKNIWLDPDILNISYNLIENGDLTVFTSNNPNDIGRHSDSAAVTAFESNTQIIKMTSDDDHRILKISTPFSISGQKIGVVQSLFTLESIDHNIASVVKMMSIYYVVITLLFILLFYAFIRLIIINPILEVNDALKAVSAGDLSKRIAVRMGDEIGDLALAFNGMTSALKVSYDNLRKEEAKLVASINSLSLGFIIADVNGGVIMANGAITRLFNLTESKTLLEDIALRLSDEFDLLKEYADVLKNKTPSSFPEVGLSSRYLKIFMAPVNALNNRGKPIGVIILFEDITEQKILEQAKGNFIAITSHEMRTPLTIIRGNSELLLRSLDASPFDKKSAQKMAVTIGDYSVKLLDILKEFLNVISLEAKQVEVKKEPLDIVELTKKIIDDLQAPAVAKGLYLKLESPGISAFTLTTNQAKARQVVTNLISNAIRYTEKGGVTVAIKKSGKFIKISVSDTGIGIPKEDQVYLFKKFSIISKSFLKSTDYGSGLGLYISRLLMESIGGTVELEKSEVGVGSVFSAQFPIES